MDQKFDYKKEIHEISEASKVYAENLESIKREVLNAQDQIMRTYQETDENIQKTFSNLRKTLYELLEKREKTLREKAANLKNEGLCPVNECLTLIHNKLRTTNTLIDLAGDILGPDEKLVYVMDNAGMIGTLPEVPEPKEVPNLSFVYETSNEEELKSLCCNFGEVCRKAPIEIKSLTPKPGAILVEWQQSFDTGDDRIRDIQEFRLQRALGDTLKQTPSTNTYFDIYRGLDCQYLLRDIQISQPYSFRICCKFDGTSEWSPWSVPQVGCTTVKWFSWRETEGAILSNDNKILRIDKAGKIVYSDDPPVALDDAVEFTVLELDPKHYSVIGLTLNRDENLKKLLDSTDGTFLIDSNGRIFIDGTEKSTVLPKFVKNLKVCFSLEKSIGNKVRVHVDVSDKRVTYDWSVGDSNHLFFACQTMSAQWKFMVE